MKVKASDYETPVVLNALIRGAQIIKEPGWTTLCLFVTSSGAFTKSCCPSHTPEEAEQMAKEAMVEPWI